jgi:citronellol/citronellal dehydrogenase
MAKFGMSLATLGMSGELEGKVGVNALWPYTMIDTEAVRMIPGGETL